LKSQAILTEWHKGGQAAPRGLAMPNEFYGHRPADAATRSSPLFVEYRWFEAAGAHDQIGVDPEDR
jgi:hypothetical protein